MLNNPVSSILRKNLKIPEKMKTLIHFVDPQELDEQQPRKNIKLLSKTLNHNYSQMKYYKTKMRRENKLTKYIVDIDS